MAEYSVLGLGNWGTALANHLAAKGFPTLGWSIEPAIVEGVNAHNRNPLYQPQIQLSPNLKATGSLEQALESDFVVLAVPSAALDDLSPKLIFRKGSLVVSAIKGLEKRSVLTPLQFLGQHVSSGTKLAVLSGPSFASDLMLHLPVGIVAASSDETVARKVAEIFTNEWMRVYISSDPLGVELGGVLKNVIALAAGICDGMELGDSARAGLITRGLAEMTRLAVAMGAKEQTLAGLSGLGDLAMTAASPTSRNRTVGYRLGKGEKLQTILDTLGSVAEGVSTTPLAIELGKRYSVELPISEAVDAVLKGQSAPQDIVKKLILRPIKREF